MQRLALASMEIEDFGAVSARTVIAGVEAVCDPLGALYLPETGSSSSRTCIWKRAPPSPAAA